MPSNEFEIIVADTDVARRHHFQLRYQVFCLETGFEDPEKFPDQLETDEYDERSAHFLVRNTVSGRWRAACRVVLPGPEPLPIEAYCRLSDATPFPSAETAEVSRLLITNAARRRHRAGRFDPPQGRANRPSQRLTVQKRHETGTILKDLIRAIAGYCVEHGIPYTVFFITPALGRILTRMKIELRAIGGPSLYRGIRIPYLTHAAEVYQVLSQTRDRENDIPRGHSAYKRYSKLSKREVEEAFGM